MKKQIIAALLGISITAGSLTGCGISFVKDTAVTCESPTYVEPEYSEGTAPAYEYEEETACAEAPAGDCSSAADYNAVAESNYYSDQQSKRAAGAEEYCATYDYENDTLCPGVYYGHNTYINGEKYEQKEENRFQSAVKVPLSTFAADVDTASYSNLRRMINDGYGLYDIPAGSIRTEELINYFDYGYRSPRKGEMFAVNASIIDCPWNKETKLVNLGIKAKDLRNTEEIPSNIVFLVDVSGSMKSYDKLPLLQMGMDMLIDDLGEKDRVSIVTYSGSSDVVLAGVSGDEHSTIKRAMNSLKAGGSTNGGDGIRTAYRLAEKYFIDGGNNRVIMATDGDLNVGITSKDELEELISKKKESGVFLSVLGFGTGNYNETTLETLADKGNGNYSYIDCLSEAKKVLVDEFNSTLFTVAKDVKFQIEFNPKYVSEYRQIGYENRQMAAKDFNDDTKDGGEIGSGHEVTVMYEIKLNDEDADNEEEPELKYQKADLTEYGNGTDEWMTVSVRYKEPDEDESKLATYPISKECYTARPNCDTLFAAYVAECGMILNDSEHIDISMSKVSKQISKLDLDDEYKEEFYQLIRQL